MRKCVFAFALVSLFATSFALAEPLNYDSAAPRTAAVPDAGWSYDEVGARLTDSTLSPYVGVFTEPTYFRITDYFLTGDTFFVFDFGLPILTTSYAARSSVFPIGDPSGDLGWVDPSYQTGEILLAPGAHSITIQGDGAGGFPAGFYVRFDTVPEPATLGLLALGGLVMLRRWH